MAGPYVSRYGDVITSALDHSDGTVPVKLWSNFSLVVGQVISIYTIDAGDEHPHDKFETKPMYTVYDVMVINNDGSNSVLRGCRLAGPAFGGGANNFFEVVQTNPKSSEIAEVGGDRSKVQGHFVIVGFVNGHMSDAVILGSLPHPSDVAKKNRPKKADGVHTQGEIQGLNFKVDKDGAFTLTYTGPRHDNLQDKKAGEIMADHFKGKKKDQKTKLEEKNQDDFPGEDAPTVIKIDKDGNVTLTNNMKQRVKVDRLKKTIRIDNAETYINMEQGENGDAKIQIVANNIEIGHKDKKTTQSMKGKNALQPMVVGDDWQQIMTELIDQIMAIVVPTGVGPSGNPVNKEKFRAIQNKLGQALSKKHKVEK